MVATAELNHAADKPDQTPTPLSENVPHVSERLMFRGILVNDPAPVNDLGGGLRLVSERRVKLTHDRANELLTLPEFKVGGSLVDRPLRDLYVSRLLNAMKRGTFHPEWVCLITAFCKEEVGDLPPGAELRMNGQHTCWARLYMPEDWPCLVRWQRYEASTVADLRILYGSIDRAAPRTNGNVINSYLAGTPQFEGVDAKFLSLLAAGAAFWVWEKSNERRLRDADETAYLFQATHADLANRIVAFFQSGTRGQMTKMVLYRSPVLAAMFETFDKLAHKAVEFWSVVRDGVGGDVSGINDPRIRLHNVLRESAVGGAKMGASRSTRGGKKLVGGEVMYRWCIGAWNAWRAGENLKMVRASLGDKRPKARR